MVILKWYKFIFTDKRYTLLDRLEFIFEHISFFLASYFALKAIFNLNELDKYLGLAFFFLTPILFTLRRSYKKFTLPFDEEYFKNNDMSDKQKEMFKVKEDLMGVIEENYKPKDK